ncbi:MAG: SDR family NAD(P)-dependent oxidoreductase [Chloroflexi bacterium]|nr:SDR family NAD(P)-dependent oxidoreductase [Chloroflexota bacterium]
MDWLKGKVAIVTGSGQGIGRAIARAMAAEGARLVTNSRRPGTSGGDAETTAGEISKSGGQAVPFFGDVSRFTDAEKLVRTATDTFGRLDILVNNAVVYGSGLIWEAAEEGWDGCMDTGLKGVFNCTRHASAIRKEQRWGRILSAASVSWKGSYANSTYGAAKAGIVGFTRCIARDLGQFGITCNAYAPHAATRWTMSEDAVARQERRYRAGMISKEQFEDAVHKVPAPEVVPPFLVYLCTDLASDINGQVFAIRGGKIAVYTEPKEANPIFKQGGMWTVEELREVVPNTVLKDYKNPAPPGAPQ